MLYYHYAIAMTNATAQILFITEAVAINQVIIYSEIDK